MDLAVRQTLQGLVSDVSNDVFKTLTHYILFPPRPNTYVGYLHSKLKGQYAINRSQQRRNIYQAGKIQKLENLLVEKDKEILRLNQQIRSLKNKRSRQ